MAGSAMHLFSMIFGDEVHFEVAANAGVNVALKGALRMEGAAQLLRIFSTNVGYDQNESLSQLTEQDLFDVSFDLKMKQK